MDMLEELQIDRLKPIPLGEQICTQVRDMIKTGKLAEHQKLPTLREFEKGLGIGICTIQKAFVELEKEGYITKRPHLGIFVQSLDNRKEKQEEESDSGDLNNLCVAIVSDEVSAVNRRCRTVIETFEGAVSLRKGKTFMLKTPHEGLPIDELKKQLSGSNAIFYIGYGEEANDLFVRSLLSTGLPLVTYSYRGGIKASGVYDDWDWAMKEVIDHLSGLGHRKIAMASFYLENKENFPWINGREKAFLDISSFKGLPVAGKDIYRAGFYDGGPEDQAVDVGEKVGNMIFAQSEAYTAVIAINDQFAEGVFNAAEKRGIKIPDDVSLAGFDNSLSSIERSLTTVAHPLEEDGRAAANILMKLYLDKDEEKIHQVINKPKLIIRKTTKAPRAKGE